MIKGCRGFILVGLVCLLAGCPYSYQSDNKRDKTEGVAMLMKEKIKADVFENVPLNTYQESPCSPELPGPLWRGIIIRAPGKVLFKKGEVVPDETGWYMAFMKIPVCGLYMLQPPAEKDLGFLKIVAQDKKTGRAYSGDVYDKDPSPIVPQPDSEKSRKAGRNRPDAIGRYFNPNLAAFVSLPQEPAVYEVYVEFWGHRSNVVTVELEEKK